MATSDTTPKKTAAKRSRRASVPKVEDKKSSKTAVDALTPAAHLLHEIPLDQIESHPDNPRKDLGDLTELSASIAEQGVLEPVLVVPVPGSGKFPSRFRTIAGHRRCAAARDAGLLTVPAIIREGLSDAEQLEVMVVENAHRNDLNVIEQGEAFQGLLDYGVKRTAIAKRTGFTAKTVSSRVKVAALPDAIRTEVLERQLTFAEAEDFADLKQSAPDLFERALSADVSKPAAVVRSALNAHAVAERKRKAIEEWNAKGHELRVGYYHSDDNASPGAITVRYTLEMSPAEHANCAGAVVYCGEWGLDNVERYGQFYCEQPDLHADRIAELEKAAAEDQPKPEESLEQKARRELSQGLTDARRVREVWLDGLFTAPTPENADARRALTEVAHDMVVGILSGDLTLFDSGFGETYPRAEEHALDPSKLKDPADAFALYVLTEQINVTLPQDAWDLDHVEDDRHAQRAEALLNAMQQSGYELSTAEQQILVAIENARVEAAAITKEGEAA